MRSILLCLCLAGFLYPAAAQPPVSYFVFSIKGSGYYLRDRFRIPLKIGSALSVTDEMVLNPRAEVMLLCNKYSLFTIRSEQGVSTVALKKCTDSCKEEGPSAAVKTLAYIWNRFTNEEGDVAGNKNDHLQEVGASTRGCADAAYDLLPDTLAVFQDGLFLRYKPADTAEQYRLLLFAGAKGGSPVFQSSLSGNRFAFPDTVIDKLDSAGRYYYTVTRNGQEFCQRKIVRKMKAYTVRDIIRTADGGEGFLQLPASEMDCIEGYYLKKAHLLAEAWRQFHHAAGVDPGNWLAAREAEELDRIIDCRLLLR
jgi:hypothetical protein